MLFKEPVNNKKSIWLLIPLFGTLLYVLLYILATLFYPGGSQFDKTTKGFSWTQNYWCNLLNENAINGQHNPGRPVAMLAQLVLCFTLIVFWYIFPKQVAFNKTGRLTIQLSGFLSMITGMFLFTSLHDIVINAATLLGLIAVAGMFIGLIKLKWIKLLWMGVFILLLVALNNLLYYGSGLLVYLPLVQKGTFLYFLLWVCLINIQLYKKQVRSRGLYHTM